MWPYYLYFLSSQEEAGTTLQTSEYSATSAGQTEAERNSIILHNTQITDGTQKVAISFVPKTVG